MLAIRRKLSCIRHANEHYEVFRKLLQNAVPQARRNSNSFRNISKVLFLQLSPISQPGQSQTVKLIYRYYVGSYTAQRINALVITELTLIRCAICYANYHTF
jgi:hypothetical protein